jgi:hypothetical protein
MRFTGRVIDTLTDDGLPSSTVELWTGNVMLARTAADSSGYFDIGTASTPDLVKISSVGYKNAAFPYDQVVDDSYFPLERDVKELEDVIITSVKKNPWPWLGAGLLFLLLISKKR